MGARVGDGVENVEGVETKDFSEDRAGEGGSAMGGAGAYTARSLTGWASNKSDNSYTQ